MASTIPELRCAICGKPIDPFGPFFRASGSFLDRSDALRRFCNAPLHWDCYQRWPERSRFARRYVEAWVAATRRNPFWWSVHLDERLYVSVNPERPVEEASVRLLAIGSDLRVPLARWSEWLAHPERVSPGLHPLEREALTEALPLLHERFPDDHALVDAIDPDEKRRGAKPKPRVIAESDE